MDTANPIEHNDDRWLITTVAVALLAFLLGVIGLAIYHPEPLVELIYHSLQLFVLGSDPVAGGGPYNVILIFAMFLAPATTIYGLVRLGRSFLRERLERRAVARTVNHAVVTGDTMASVALAGNLAAGGAKVVLIGSDPDQVARRQRIPVIRGDARELTTLRAAGVQRAAALYACSFDTAQNAAVVLSAKEMGDRSSRLEAFAQVSSDELVEALRVRQVASASQRRRVSIDFFSLEDIAARQLLNGLRDIPTSVEIIGSGPFARALLHALVRHPGMVGSRSILVTTDYPEPADIGLLGDHATGPTVLLRNRENHPSDHADCVFVCLTDEDDGLRTALKLSRVVKQHVTLCLLRQAPFRQALIETPRLEIFGILDAACAHDLISADAVIGRAARAIHQRYVEGCIARGDTAETNASLRPWAELPLELQEANYAQAEHIAVKLAAIDCGLVTIQSGLPPFDFRPGEINKLARLEHARWVAERRGAGLVYGPTRSGNEHPDLVDWAHLSDESKSKDLDAVKALPGLLAGAGLCIQRRST